jgi:CDP-glucose 4,6-dehydratase
MRGESSMLSKANAERVPGLRDFYQGKKVLVTGHSGFKGSWLTALLTELGAEVVGISLPLEGHELFKLLDSDRLPVTSHFMDIRDRSIVELIAAISPDVVFHLAAQPIVSVGYQDPYGTFTSNVIGTVNVLDGVRAVEKRVSVVNVTTDKVYRNYEKAEGYREGDELMGQDPYSASKSAAEVVAYSYQKSFFEPSPESAKKIMSTARAGNVIGGGDFSVDRIIPDLVAAWRWQEPLTVRNPESVRPYEHVLDAVFAYVILAAEQYATPALAGPYNIGPDSTSLMRTHELVDFFASRELVKAVYSDAPAAFKETHVLTLNSDKFRSAFAWKPEWESKDSILQHTLDWYSDWIAGYNATDITFKQIREFLHDSF